MQFNGYRSTRFNSLPPGQQRAAIEDVASKLGLLAKNVVPLVHASSAKAYATAAQNLAATTWTKVLFNVLEHDILDEWDGGSFVPRETGAYLVTTLVKTASLGAGGYLRTALYRNDATLVANLANAATIGGLTYAPASLLVRLDSNEQYSLYAYASGAATLDYGLDSGWITATLLRT